MTGQASDTGGGFLRYRRKKFFSQGDILDTSLDRCLNCVPLSVLSSEYEERACLSVQRERERIRESACSTI